MEDPAAEAKKAEGASWVTLQIPRPPHQTGKVASDQVRSFAEVYVGNGP